MKLGAAKSHYQWLPAGPQNLEKLRQVAQVAEVYAGALQDPPKSVQHWLDKFDQVTQALAKLKSPMLAKSSTYLVPWLFRVWAISKMRAQGISQLVGAEKMSAKAFHAMFPDQKGCVQQLLVRARSRYYRGARDQETRRPGEMTMQDMMNYVGYGGPTEMFTCWLCLASSPAVHQVDTGDLQQDILEAQMRQYRAKFGIWPSVAELMRGLTSSNRAGGMEA